MKVSKCFVALFLVAACATGAMAQAPGDFLMVFDIQVRPGANMQFEEYLNKVKEAADETDAPQRWITAQATYGRSLNNYLVALQFGEWGALDGWSQVPVMLREAFGEDEAAKIFRSGTASIESAQNTVSRLLTDLSYNAEAGVTAPMVQVRISEIRRDKQDDYRHFLSKVNEAWEKAGDNRTIIRRVAALGQTAVYSSATPFTNWSEWDAREGEFQQRMVAAHGEGEARRLQESVSESVVSSELFVVTVRPDLSRMPEGASTSE